MEGRKLKLGDDHPYTLQTVNDLGVLRREQKEYEEEESLLRQALDDRQRKLGNDHPACFESIHELAVAGGIPRWPGNVNKESLKRARNWKRWIQPKSYT